MTTETTSAAEPTTASNEELADDEPLLTASEVGKMLAINGKAMTDQGVLHMMRRGELPAARETSAGKSKRYWFSLADVHRVKAARNLP